MLSFGETILTNSLRNLVPVYAPGIDPEAVIAVGATGVRGLITNATQLADVLFAYTESIDRVFYLVIGCSAACFLFAWPMGFKDIRKKPKPKPAEAPEVQKEDANEVPEIQKDGEVEKDAAA
jgi:hypothetical protein